jgi:hypothetical protein
MKPWLMASLIAFALPCAAERMVDLDRPGALQALERANPAHFAKVQRILHEAPRLPLGAVQGWVRTQFDAREVSSPYVLRTSYPAQANLSFVLDDTRYSAVIRLDAEPKPTPAK